MSEWKCLISAALCFAVMYIFRVRCYLVDRHFVLNVFGMLAFFFAGLACLFMVAWVKS